MTSPAKSHAELLAELEAAQHRIRALESRIARQREGEERFRRLFEDAPDGFYLIDTAGRFVDGNRAAERIAGCSREELIGKSFFDLDLLRDEDLARAGVGHGHVVVHLEPVEPAVAGQQDRLHRAGKGHLRAPSTSSEAMQPEPPSS